MTDEGRILAKNYLWVSRNGTLLEATEASCRSHSRPSIQHGWTHDGSDACAAYMAHHSTLLSPGLRFVSHGRPVEIILTSATKLVTHEQMPRNSLISCAAELSLSITTGSELGQIRTGSVFGHGDGSDVLYPTFSHEKHLPRGFNHGDNHLGILY